MNLTVDVAYFMWMCIRWTQENWLD